MRRTRSRRSWGRRLGCRWRWCSFSFLGIAVTSASAVVFGEPIWNPVALLGRFHQPLIAFLGLIALLVATLNVNIGANVVGPSNDFANLAPRFISFRTGGLITGFLGLAMMPWKLMATFGSYIFGWLVGYSGLLGPVAGIMVADYFVIRGTRLDTYSLYRRGGVYEYRNGINPKAIVALVVGSCSGADRAVCAAGCVPLQLCMVHRFLPFWRGVRFADASAAQSRTRQRL